MFIYGGASPLSRIHRNAKKIGDTVVVLNVYGLCAGRRLPSFGIKLAPRWPHPWRAFTRRDRHTMRYA
jgi:hypothetical protein